jgi:hypothetical protein
MLPVGNTIVRGSRARRGGTRNRWSARRIAAENHFIYHHHRNGAVADLVAVT